MASKEGHVNVVQELLEKNAFVDAATKKGNTALHIARLTVVAILLENDSKSKIRLSALHIAAIKNDVKAAALLLNNDPNMNLSPEVEYTFFIYFL